MASVLPGTLRPGIVVSKDYPAGPASPPEYGRREVDDPEGTITMVSFDIDPKWMKAPSNLTPTIKKGQRLNVLSSAITPQASPWGAGHRFWQLEGGILVVDVGGKKGFAWCKIGGCSSKCPPP